MSGDLWGQSRNPSRNQQMVVFPCSLAAKDARQIGTHESCR